MAQCQGSCLAGPYLSMHLYNALQGFGETVAELLLVGLCSGNRSELDHFGVSRASVACLQQRLDYFTQQKHLPNTRDVRQEEQRLAAAMTGLECTIQHKQADLKVGLPGPFLTSSISYPHMPP